MRRPEKHRHPNNTSESEKTDSKAKDVIELPNRSEVDPNTIARWVSLADQALGNVTETPSPTESKLLEPTNKNKRNTA